MKGIDLNRVKLIANERYQDETEEQRIWHLYRDLYYGKPIEFDLTRTKVRMEMTREQRMKNKESMIRTPIFDGTKKKYEEN